MLLDMLNTIHAPRGRPIQILMGEDALEQLKKEAKAVFRYEPNEKKHFKNGKKIPQVYFLEDIPIEIMGPKNSVHYVYERT